MVVWRIWHVPNSSHAKHPRPLIFISIVVIRSENKVIIIHEEKGRAVIVMKTLIVILIVFRVNKECFKIIVSESVVANLVVSSGSWDSHEKPEISFWRVKSEHWEFIVIIEDWVRICTIFSIIVFSRVNWDNKGSICSIKDSNGFDWKAISCQISSMSHSKVFLGWRKLKSGMSRIIIRILIALSFEVHGPYRPSISHVVPSYLLYRSRSIPVVLIIHT